MNATVRRHHREATLGSELSDVVDQYKDTPAIVTESATLNYASLWAASSRVAELVRLAGCESEQLIVIPADRSAETIINMVGLVRAGCAYLPVSRHDPEARLRQICESSGATVLMGRASDVELASRLGCSLLRADPSVDAVRELGGEAFADGEGLAYVMYTSGSTGSPKGVEVTHANVLARFGGPSFIEISPHDTILQFAPLTFDAATFEIWGTLLNGATLAVPSDKPVSAATIRDAIQRFDVTTLWLTAPLFHALMAADPAALDALPRVLVGGDVVRPSTLRTFLRRKQRLALNGYGPTETTTFAATHTLEDLADSADVVPIGTALAETNLYVLGSSLDPVPDGSVGELYVGGAGVARGYRNDAPLTAARFVPDPWCPGQRMYRTGDLVCRRAGSLEFVGRIDDQVKVRGFRVHLSEVAATLRELPGVDDALVVAEHDEAATSLRAYVVTADQHVTSAQLQNALGELLPPFMIPWELQIVAALPLAESGKVDHQGLVMHSAEAANHGQNDQAPTSNVKEALCRIWARVLGLADVSDDADFFLIGGDSISAIRVIAEAEREGIPISIADLFESPTIADLARKRAGTQRNQDVATPRFGLVDDESGSVLAGEFEDAYPMTSLQLAMLFHAELVGESLYHDAVVFQVKLPLEAQAVEDSIEQLVARHDALRTSFSLARRGRPLQLVGRRARMPITVVPVAESGSMETADDWLRREVHEPFQFERAPLARMTVVSVDQQRFEVRLGIHHAIVDGWSLSILISEFLALYEAALTDRPIALEPVSAARIADYVRAEESAKTDATSIEFWGRKLHGVGRVLVGTSDRSAERERCVVHLPTELASAVHDRAATAAVLPRDVLLAAHLMTVATVARTSRPVSGVVTNGRPDVAGADTLVGLFLNVVPVVADVDDGSEQLVRDVAGWQRETAVHRRYPLSEIQRLHGQLFDVVFNYADFRIYRQQRIARLLDAEPEISERTSFAVTAHAVARVDAIELDVSVDPHAVAFSADVWVSEMISSLHALSRDPD